MPILCGYCEGLKNRSHIRSCKTSLQALHLSWLKRNILCLLLPGSQRHLQSRHKPERMTSHLLSLQLQSYVQPNPPLVSHLSNMLFLSRLGRINSFPRSIEIILYPNIFKVLDIWRGDSILQGLKPVPSSQIKSWQIYQHLASVYTREKNPLFQFTLE